MNDEGRPNQPGSPLDRRNRLNDLLVQEATNLRKSIAALIWKFDLARDHEAVAELTEEVFQEAAMRAWTQADEYDPNLSGHAWLNLIAINVLHEQRRRIYRERKLGLAPEVRARPTAHDPEADPLEWLLDNRGFDEARAQELLDIVMPEERKFLHARYVLNLTPEQLADQFGLNRGAIYTRLSRARQSLRDAWKKLDESGEE